MFMNLEDKLLELRVQRKGAFMPHVYYGDPTIDFSMKLISTLNQNGADIIEFGIPFSDPTADGPTFQAACERALKNSITPSKCFQGLKKLRAGGVDKPFIITTYYNIPYVMGIIKFLEEIKSAGAQGIIVPNLPFEEADLLREEAEKKGIHVILQIAPTTSEKRLRKITNSASGFIYVINIEGVTGARDRISGSTLKLIERVKRHTDLPIFAGFGISNYEQAAAIVASGADGVIAGSVFAKIYEKNIVNPERALPEIVELSNEIKAGCIKGYEMRKPKCISN
jgi:tryptophan synthase alpha chain